jgi:hypothetical protein
MYRVKWLQSALNELARFWTSADSDLRRLITAASYQIDQELRTRPEALGESRPKGRRIMFVPPLAVTYRIEADGRTVLVSQIRMLRRRN